MSIPHALAPAAIETVLESCIVARHVQARLDDVREMTKDDRSPVTVADFAVQAIVALDLAARAPGTHIVGEERADLLRDPSQAAIREAVVDAVQSFRPDVTEAEILDAIDRCDHDGSGDAYWALDPIDGTKGFLRGQQYAIALAWIEAGEVTLGVLGCPNLPETGDLTKADAKGTIYAAARSGGAWAIDPVDRQTPPQPISAARPAPGAGIRVCESVEAAHSKQSDTIRILAELGEEGLPVRLDSQCKYAVVARGQADAYLRLPTKKGYVEKIWDHAAGSLVAREAGAIVSDIAGNPLDFSHGSRLEQNRGVICAAAVLHERIIEAIEHLEIDVPV